jgi:BirA family biotin operon repressor/biotin-[acetyl-CoA-carboxylase] ligase
MENKIKYNKIHKEQIESTIPVSQEMIKSDPNIENFLLNCDEQTQGRGSGDRKWSSSQIGNVYSTFNLRKKYIPEKILKLTPYIIGITIVEHLNKYSEDKFNIKWPNDILCKDGGKVCGILVDKFEDFYMLSFGVNLVWAPPMTEIREGGRAPCFLGKHCNNVPKAFDFSVEVCDDICKKLVSYDSDMVIKDWKKYANMDILIKKRGEENGEDYKQIDLNNDGFLIVQDKEGKEEILKPVFPFLQ